MWDLVRFIVSILGSVIVIKLSIQGFRWINASIESLGDRAEDERQIRRIQRIRERLQTNSNNEGESE